MNQLPSIRQRRRHNATTLHETNFRKLNHIVPGLRELEETLCVHGTGNIRLELQMLENSRFTKTIALRLQHPPTQPWLPSLHMKIRNYYDAGVTEALTFQHHHRLNSRYSYPNPQMYHRNEKWQINRFLGEWLDHCLLTRCIFRDIIESLGT
jgi:uncharacterized protein YqiB (DUF1249 family)